MVSAWRNFKNIFSRPLFTIIFRPEMLKFHPYSILTADTMVRFVIFCVLSILRNHDYKISSSQNKQSERNSPVISLVNWFEKAKSSIRLLQDSNQSNESLTCQPKYLSSGSWIKGFQGLKHLFLALSCIWMEISSASAKNWLCLSWDRKVPLWGQTKKCWLDQLKKDIFSISNINAMFFQLNQNLTTDYLFNFHVSWSGHFPATG